LAALTREQLAERLELKPLDEPATSQLVLMLAGRTVNTNLGRSLFAASDGNPLFLEQLVLTLREDGRLDGDLDSFHQLLTDASTVPSVVRELIEGRLARLTPRARETLETAAVLGHAFDYADLL